MKSIPQIKFLKQLNFELKNRKFMQNPIENSIREIENKIPDKLIRPNFLFPLLIEFDLYTLKKFER